MTVEANPQHHADGKIGHGPLPHDLLHHVAVLCRASNHLRRHLEHTVLRDAKLTWSSYDVLQLAAGRRPIDVRTITDVTGLARATVTLAVKDLIGRQLVRRLPGPGDGRHHVLRPTVAGLQLARRLHARLAEALADLVNHPASNARRDAAVALHRIART